MALADPKQHIVVTTGPAGTGKTYLATLRAIQALREGECKRIMLVRPAVAVDGESHGFLPGDLNQKLEPWCLPLLDILHEFYKPHEVSKMISDKVIEMAPLSMMRGRTLRDVFLIADEMQNASPNQCLMLLTRIGENSKFVFTGDVAQTDKRVGFNGLLDICAKLEQTPIDGISLCTFNERDIQRHPLIGKILKLYGE
jgi:phosphate starvation-inducible PhoH-like protein